MKSCFSLKKEIRLRIIWSLVVGFLVLLVTTIVYQLWNYNFTIPFKISGDAVSSLVLANNMIRGGWVYKYEWVTPFVSYRYSRPIGFLLHACLLKFITFFTSNPAIAVNVFYLLGFILIGVICFNVLVSMNIEYIYSLIGAVLYTQLPYHYMRNISHLWLSSYYVVPLAVLLLYYIISGKIISIEEKGDSSESGIKGKVEWKLFIYSLIVGILLGCSDIYYSAFFLILCCASAILCALFNRKIIYFLVSFGSIFSTIAALIVTLYVPKIGRVFSGNSVVRSYGDTDCYSLKWIYLLLPIQNHRITLLSNLRKFIDSNFLYNNENGYVSLGIVLSIGLIYSIYSCINIKRDENISSYMGILSLVAIAYASFGGISTLVATLLTASIRSTNRIAIYIAMFATVSFCLGLERLVKRILSFRNKIFLLEVLVCGVITCFGVWDMTSRDYVTYSSFDPFTQEWISTREDDEKRVESDRKFWNEIENEMQPGSKVLELPIVSDTIYGYFPNGETGNQTHLYPMLYTENLKFSNGDVQGGETDQWLSKVKKLPSNILIQVAIHVGFNGIYIDPKGYDEEELIELLSALDEIVENEPIKSEVGGLLFYNLSDYASKTKQQYTEKQWDDISNYLLYDFEGFDLGKFVASELYYSNGEKQKFSKEGMAKLEDGDLQYGPYIKVQKNLYEVRVKGKNLNEAEVFCLAELEHQAIEIISQTDDEIVYQIQFDKPLENVEFCLKSKQGEIIWLESLEYKTLNENMDNLFTNDFEK